MNKPIKKSISEYLDQDYLKYAKYVVEHRAIPSVIDGLKPTHRKVIYVADKIWKKGTEKPYKVFQFSGRIAADAHYHHGDCLDPNTEILLSDGSFITIEEWFNNHPDSSLKVLAYDENSNKFIEATGHSPRIGQVTDLEYEIKMEDGSIFKCTENHPFLTQRGWIEAKDLTENDDILSLISSSFMKIKSIKVNKLDSPKNFYDITVDKYHNFVIGSKSKIVTHNSSLNSAIITMAQKFKNSMPLLEEIGQFGSLRSPEAGAPRYISTKLHSNFRLIYKDFELLSQRFEEGSEIEPSYFLPIIPTVLLNGSSGIAVGFASNILNRNPLDLIECCLKELDGKSYREPQPWIRDFKGEIVKNPDSENSWIFKGVYEVKNTATVHITEIPPSITYEKYDNHLNGLEDTRKISTYDNNCKSNIDYSVKMSRSDLAKKQSNGSLSKFLKLEEKQSENLTVLDEHGKLKEFDNVNDIIKYFVKFRLTYYDKRKKYLIDKINYEILVLSNKARFIKMIIDKKLKINNVPRQQVVDALVKAKFDEVDGGYSYLLSMPIHTLTKEKYEELLKHIEDKKAELSEIKKTKPDDMYKNDLNELKKVVKKEF